MMHDAHIKCTPKPRCAICTGFEDTTKMLAPGASAAKRLVGALAIETTPFEKPLQDVEKPLHFLTNSLSEPNCLGIEEVFKASKL
jgi:hypothetical protein